jgi:hypothetical protein
VGRGKMYNIPTPPRNTKFKTLVICGFSALFDYFDLIENNGSEELLIP